MAARILIADDSTTVRRVVVQSLEPEGHEVIAVADGEEALRRAREARPDLVLADVLMPSRSGYELVEAIEEDEHLRGTPVLLLSGAFEPFDEARAERCGARGHLVKPFQSASLVSRVREVLEGSAQVSSSRQPAEAGESGEDLLGVLEATWESRSDERSQQRASAEEAAFPLETDEEPIHSSEKEPSDERGGGISLPGESGFSVVPPSSPWRRSPHPEPAPRDALSSEEMRQELARKVEELAPEIIREVAWEVVPDLLERLLREAADRPPVDHGRDDRGEDRR